jgi:glycosyltransferase involved in cell wall biosynthesis
MLQYRPGGGALPQFADGDVAIVHDYLNQCGGAERVVLSMAKIWPEAPIYTSLYRPESTFPGFENHRVETGWINSLPVDRGFRAILPLYPSAFRSLGVLEQPVVLSSSSGWAHGVRVAPDSTHIVYCHAPARWLYSGQQYFDTQGRRERLAHRVLSPLRRWDQRVARRPDRYIANAYNVAERIKAVYGIDADVVHPAVEIGRFTPRPRGERLLIVSRLLRYKNLDLVVEAATRLGIGLDVVGAGPDLERLRSLAGPTVVFHGAVDDAALKQLMETCNALCFPGREDFGIAPVEANAAGKPVVAFAAGGALETLEDGVSASFFHRQTVEDVMWAIRRMLHMETNFEVIAESALRFSPMAFERRLKRAIRAAMAGEPAGADIRAPRMPAPVLVAA